METTDGESKQDQKFKDLYALREQEAIDSSDRSTVGECSTMVAKLGLVFSVSYGWKILNDETRLSRMSLLFRERKLVAGTSGGADLEVKI